MADMDSEELLHWPETSSAWNTPPTLWMEAYNHPARHIAQRFHIGERGVWLPYFLLQSGKFVVLDGVIDKSRRCCGGLF